MKYLLHNVAFFFNRLIVLGLGIILFVIMFWPFFLGLVILHFIIKFW